MRLIKLKSSLAHRKIAIDLDSISSISESRSELGIAKKCLMVSLANRDYYFLDYTFEEFAKLLSDNNISISNFTNEVTL